VNVISPGVTDTAGVDELFGGGEQAAQVKNMFIGNIPAGRIGKPQETAASVLFLASEESSYVNGIELFVDGGMNQV
jgi:NAD(P)-dependent dehydrogenase (short-subunit alcohol dehydrogenase family)